MPDIARLKRAISHFKFKSRPSSGYDSTPATVGDINKLVDSISEMLSVFVDELQNKN